jgi:hypothetical protein
MVIGMVVTGRVSMVLHVTCYTYSFSYGVHYAFKLPFCVKDIRV